MPGRGRPASPTGRPSVRRPVASCARPAASRRPRSWRASAATAAWGSCSQSGFAGRDLCRPASLPSPQEKEGDHAKGADAVCATACKCADLFRGEEQLSGTKCSEVCSRRLARAPERADFVGALGVLALPRVPPLNPPGCPIETGVRGRRYFIRQCRIASHPNDCSQRALSFVPAVIVVSMSCSISPSRSARRSNRARDCLSWAASQIEHIRLRVGESSQAEQRVLPYPMWTVTLGTSHLRRLLAATAGFWEISKVGVADGRTRPLTRLEGARDGS